jgi:CRISPR-associated protein Csh2
MNNKRVFGSVGVYAKNANWNADFTGRPRTSNGKIFASDVSLKWACREHAEKEGQDVFWKESRGTNGNSLMLKDKYETVHGKIPKNESVNNIEKNLFSHLDLRWFGFTFAAAGAPSTNATGAIQISNAENALSSTQIVKLTIGCPWADKTKEQKKEDKAKTKVKKDDDEEIEDTDDSIGKSSSKADSTTLGTKYITDKALYVYDISINDNTYREFEKRLHDNTKTILTTDDINNFKENMKYCVTTTNSASKKGCSNGYAIFVTLKENSKTYLSDVSQYIKFIETDDKIQMDLSDFTYFDKADVESIEVYYQQNIIDVINVPQLTTIALNTI